MTHDETTHSSAEEAQMNVPEGFEGPAVSVEIPKDPVEYLTMDISVALSLGRRLLEAVEVALRTGKNQLIEHDPENVATVYKEEG
jgi:hypothetical protein